MKKVGLLALIVALSFGAFGFSQSTRAQSPDNGAQAIAGLIDIAVQNTSALNNSPISVLDNAINGSTIQVVNLNDVLNGNQTMLLSNILNDSQVLSQNVVTVQNILNNSLNNDTVLSGFLNNNNVTVDHVVALDVLSASPTIYVFNPGGNGNGGPGNGGPGNGNGGPGNGGPGNGNGGPGHGNGNGG